MADPLEMAAQRLEASAKALVDFPALMRAALTQREAEIARTPAQPGLLQRRAAEIEAGAARRQDPLAAPRAEIEARAVAQTPTPAQPPIPLAPAYVYQPTPTGAQQQAQAQQQQHYPAGGIPAWQQPAPMAPQQQAQQAAAAGPTPGDLALAAARATPLGGAQTGAQAGAVTDASRALSSLRVGALAAAAALGMIAELGAKASPTHAATLSASFDLLQAKLGSYLLPTIEELARAAQRFANMIPDPDKERGFLGGRSYGEVIKSGTVGPLELIENIFKLFKEPQELKLSYKALPQPSMSTFEQQYDKMQMAALSQGPLETDLLQEQVKNLERIVGLLEKGTGPEAAVDVNFR